MCHIYLFLNGSSQFTIFSYVHVKHLEGLYCYLFFRIAVTGAVRHTKSLTTLPVYDQIRVLQEDIRNGPLHVFGDHSRCKEYFCSGSKPGEDNLVGNLKAYGIWQGIMSANYYLSGFVDSLLQSVTTNMVESFNSIVCKFVAGKRLNLVQRNTYTTRSELSALAMNEKENAHRVIYKQLTCGVSPGKHSQVFRNRRKRQRLLRVKAAKPLKSKKVTSLPG